jgi:hypothetical protein
MQSWLDALKTGDMTALQRILPEDYSITVSDGRLLNREQDLEPVAKKEFRFASAETDSVNVRLFGSTAVVTGIARFIVLMGDRSISVRERFTDVYTKRQGIWQPVASHSTNLKN